MKRFSRIFGGQNLFNFFNCFLQIDQGKADSAARNWIHSAPKQTRRPLPLLLSPAFSYDGRPRNRKMKQRSKIEAVKDIMTWIAVNRNGKIRDY